MPPRPKAGERREVKVISDIVKSVFGWERREEASDHLDRIPLGDFADHPQHLTQDGSALEQRL